MSRFREELKLIPPVARVIGVALWIGIALLLLLLPFTQDPELRQWPLAAKLAVAALPGIPLFLLALLVGYVYADARRRGMRYVMWTFLAALIPNAIGIILYFILREPLWKPCPQCGTPGKPGYAFCQSCGAALARACPQCRHAVEPGWSHCVSCGAPLV